MESLLEHRNQAERGEIYFYPRVQEKALATMAIAELSPSLVARVFILMVATLFFNLDPALIPHPDRWVRSKSSYDWIFSFEHRLLMLISLCTVIDTANAGDFYVRNSSSTDLFKNSGYTFMSRPSSSADSFCKNRHATGLCTIMTSPCSTVSYYNDTVHCSLCIL